MANDESTNPTEPEQQETSSSDDEKEDSSSDEEQEDSSSDSSSSSSDDSDTESDSEAEEEEKKGTAKESTDFDTEEDVLFYTRPDEELPESENTAEKNIKRFTQVLDSKYLRKRERHEERRIVYHEDLFDFPEDPEKWTEGDLKELWADAPYQMTKPGWDPNWADEEDWEVVREEIKAGRNPPIAPFYVPYRKHYPVIPDNHYDISTPQAVIEELDRIEEFMKWVSYIFPDGSSYEGTVWDDLAHGKGVYVAEQGLVRYEGEWLQNDMEGHGVVEVDIPDREPVPGSKLEAKMREEGKIISRDYMSPEDREWLEMDIEDSIRLAGGNYEIPFYENEEWIKQFGEKPQKGRYRYAGQWKHGRMHGCGVYDINEQTIYGRFYFGELLEDSTGCDENTSALHAGIAEVAAAKARMFVNKPDGMVREERGPYSDPQHPYFYEDEDVWMAPGFINQFYEVPDYWKTYVHEVDEEREMWLNSFYKAPLRIPMPAELEYWWSKDDSPEFVLINKEPEPDPEDPSKLIYTEDPLILHTRTGRLINYVEDEEHGLRLFWQPPLKDGEDVNPEKAQFLPLGFDEFYGREVSAKKETIWLRMLLALENACKPMLDKLEKWSEEKKKESEIKMELIKKELELIEAELCLENAVEDMDEELRRQEKEEEKKVKMGLIEEEDFSMSANQEPKALEDEEEEEEGDDDDVDQSSFGSIIADGKPTNNDQNGNKPSDSPFSTCSLSFASYSLMSTVPSWLQQSFLSWKEGRLSTKATPSLVEKPSNLCKTVDSVSFPFVHGHKGSLRSVTPETHKFQPRRNHSNATTSHLSSLSQILLLASTHAKPRGELMKPNKQSHNSISATSKSNYDAILSLHTPMYHLESYTEDTTFA